ncbi:hypothetical protein [Mucilaginibacter lappiensis]|uniref:hypothetical protein n=1 Tax=Mucilaginibacter lappiensis TaxID=354630 RepID=UPI003D20E558
MDKALILIHLKEVENLQRSIEDLTQYSSSNYGLADYINMLRQKLAYFDHGERDRFYVPYINLQRKLDLLLEKGEEAFQSAFKTNKTLLLSAVKSYLNKMNASLREPD